MKRFILFFALITLSFKGFAQVTVTTTTSNKDSIICLCCGPKDPSKQPLWVVNGKVITQLNLSALNPNYIEDIKVSKGNDASSKYGSSAKNGVIIIILKKNIKTHSVNKILSKNKIDLASRKLPIYSNNALIQGDSIFLPSNKKIKAVIVEANSNADNRLPFNGKYLAISETK
ncbi:TonB-dependent receptor plug domain-containing protein [Pedobacter frigiditerrae]|uniref:TonB-dependent receptor plug domain-containing protein n=1 Tax=Pedobacter frigiditerrae TaxID=2530452 RepID=UPI0029313D0D|nr:TonB-dependent receptor plug domain-containing protein [Pedobacter frigiditerrae]